MVPMENGTPLGMELYWKLASVDAAVRESASVALVRELQAQHEAYEQEIQKDRVSQQPAEEALLGAAKDEEGLENCAPGLQYALRRLVRGVSSSRESARQGFAMALASVLETLPWIKVESVLKLIKKNLEVTSSMKGQEIRDGLLGQLFALGAVVRACQLVDNGMGTRQAHLARDIADQLISLAKRKAFLREPAITVLLHMIHRLPPSSLQGSVISSPPLQEMLCTDNENATADALLLALQLNEQLPMSVRQSCPMLPDSGNVQDLFLPSHLSSLVPMLKDSSSSHPRLHPVWVTLVGLLFTERTESIADGLKTSAKKKKKRQKVEVKEMPGSLDQRLASFWSIVVDKALLTSSHERKHLVMELLHLLLPKLSPSSVHIVLSRMFVRCLLDILSAKDNLLYKSAQRCLNFLCEWAKEDEHRLVAVVLSLQKGSHGKFDTLSETQTVKQLVTNLHSKESCFLLYHSLVDLFTGGQDELNAGTQLQLLNRNSDQFGTEKDEGSERDKPGTEVGKSLEFQRQWTLEQICSLLKQLQVESGLKLSLQKEILKFLTVHTLFVGSPGMKSTFQGPGEEIKWPDVPISENTRKLCLARLQVVLVDSLQSPQSKDKTIALPKDRLIEKNVGLLDLRTILLQYCDLLDTIPGVDRAHSISEGDRATIDALQSSISQLSMATLDAEQNEKMQAMCSLIMQILIQSMTSHVNEIAAELIVCCKKTFGKFLDIDVEDDEEEHESPEYIDVLMDILLSLLAQSSAPIRVAAEQVFKAFCGDMTQSALLSLLRVVKKQLSTRRKAVTPLDVEDSEDDQILELQDSEEDINEDENMDGTDLQGNEGESKTVSADSDDEGVIDKRNITQLPGAVKEKGTEGNKEEMDNSASDSDMDDEAMFRIDAHLAKLLKQKAAGTDKGDAKDAQTQLLYFKFRVLSLVEIFFQKKSNSPLVLAALPHLLQAFVMSSSLEGHAQLADRIGSILQSKLFESKQYPKGPDLDKKSIEGLLQRSLNLASRSRIKRVGAVGQACSLWLIKVLYRLQPREVSDDGNLKAIVQNIMNDFFSKKKSRTKSSFFHEVFMRFPGLGMTCLGLLLDRCVDARSEYLQYEALRLVNAILRHKVCKDTSQSEMDRGQFQDCLKQYLPRISDVLASLLQKPASKAARKTEARRFCLFVLKKISQEFPEKSVRKLIGESAYNVCLSSLGASEVERILKTQVKTQVMNGKEDSNSGKLSAGSKRKKPSKLQSPHKK